MSNPDFKQVYIPSEEDSNTFREGGQSAIDLFRNKVWLLIYERLIEILLTDDGSNVSPSYRFDTPLNCEDDVIDFIAYYIEKLECNKVTNGELLNGYDPTYKNLIPMHTDSDILKLRTLNWAEANGKRKIVCLCSSAEDDTDRGWHGLDDYTSKDSELPRQRTIDEIWHSAKRSMQEKIKLQYKSDQEITANIQTAAAQTYHALHIEQEGRIQIEKNLHENIKPKPQIENLMNEIKSGQKDLKSQIDKKCNVIKEQPGTLADEREYQTDQITELVIRVIYKPVKAINYGILFEITEDAAMKRICRYWEDRNNILILDSKASG